MTHHVVYPSQVLDPPEPAASVGIPLVDRGFLGVLPYLVPVLVCGISWLSGGVPILTDVGFLILTGLAFVCLIIEFARFPQRLGIGGVLLFSGVIIWFSYDYFTNWFLANYSVMPFRPETVAKAAFLHCLMIMMMAAGLRLRIGRTMERLVCAVPEPASQAYYLFVMLFLFAVGMSSFVLFNSEPFYVSIYKEILGGRIGGAKWTVGRGGNLNQEGNWGAYVQILYQMGQLGAVFAAFYALLVTRNPVAKALAWSILLLWTLISFGSGSRGTVIFMVIPVIALTFIKYQLAAFAYARRFSLRAYVIALGLCFGILFLMQVQAFYRDRSFQDVDLSEVKVLEIKGNTMFSEGLVGYALIPKSHGFFYGRFPGEAILRPIPDTVVKFVTELIPRALWPGKPVDPVWEWYNRTYTGKGTGRTGGTISQGMVGFWYFRYGIPGVIEGGLLLGWLMGIVERAMRNSNARPMAVFMCLALATWLFRTFRGLSFATLYPILIGMVILYVLIKASRMASPSNVYDFDGLEGGR